MIDKRLIRESEQSMKAVKHTVLLQVFGLVMSIITIISFSLFVKLLVENNITANTLVIIVVLVVIATIIRYQCYKMSSKFSHQASDKIKYQLREKIYKKALSLNSEYVKYISTAALIQIAVEGVEQLDIYFSKYLPQLFYSVLAPLILFFVVVWFDWKSAVILFICVPLIPISIIIVQKIAKRILSKYWNDYTGLGDSFLENIQGLETLKNFRSDEDYHIEMNMEAEKFRKSTMRVLIMQLNSISIMDLVAYGGAALGIIMATSQYANGQNDIAVTIAIILLSSEFFIPMRLLGSFFHIAMNGLAASDKIYNFLNIEEKELMKECSVIGNQITFSDVNLDIGNRLILSKVNFEITSGLNAIVGVSGSGKSTLKSILTGALREYTGEIAIDNNNLNVLDSSTLLNIITVVNHDSYIFKGTIRSNLQLGKTYNDFEMETVLKKVNLWNDIVARGGLDCSIESEGSNLSGGEKQRLAFARGLLKNSPIYIFDEATSNIDVDSEKVINDQILKLAENKLVIVIAHRLRTIVTANQIICMDNGEIVEMGTHSQLMDNNGTYYRMFDKQEKLEKYFGGEYEI